MGPPAQEGQRYVGRLSGQAGRRIACAFGLLGWLVVIMGRGQALGRKRLNQTQSDSTKGSGIAKPTAG